MTLTRALAGALLVVAFFTFQPVQRLERWRAERTATQYYTAWAEADAEAACERLSDRQLDLVSGGRGGSCEASFAPGRGADPDAADGAARLTRVDGGSATVRIDGLGVFVMVRETGSWKVDDWLR